MHGLYVCMYGLCVYVCMHVCVCLYVVCINVGFRPVCMYVCAVLQVWVYFCLTTMLVHMKEYFSHIHDKVCNILCEILYYVSSVFT